jgi:acetyl-CoA acetyltransferase
MKHKQMNLPNAENAYVEERKITAYLLSFESEDGQHKAAIFTRFGFTQEQWQLFAEALSQHGQRNPVAQVKSNGRFGTNYIVEGVLTTPDGRNPEIRTVWEITDEKPAPRLITAYPL